MALTKRSEKGVSLTYTEMDANFTHLGGDGSYQFPATDGTATHVLATDGNGQLSFVPQTSGGGGIALTDLSVTTGSASGSGSLSYNNTTGAFTFAPPDLSTYLTTVAFSDLTGKPTTIAGYGITDAFDGAFSSLTGKPTTISGYGITDAFDGAFSSLTGKPTTISGYGITDAFDGATSSLTGDIDLATQVTGILPVGNMAATALTTVQTAANESAQLALTTEEGDVVVRSDESKTYMHNGGSAGTMADFTLLSTPTDSVTSVDGNTGAVTTLQLGTTSTTALAGDTTFAFSDITSTPTTISGYGITDALAIGTSSTTAMAGDTTFAFSDITSKPTTISGYGITDAIVTSDSSIDAQPIKQYYANQAAFPSASTWHGAIAHSHADGAMYFGHGGSWVQLANNSSIPTVPTTVSSFTNDSNYLTTVAFADLTGKPTTIAGYGITDALQLGTSSTTALAGDTTFAFADITSTPTTISGYGITDALAIGTSSTTAMAGDTTFAFADITSKPTTISGYGITDALAIGTSSTTAMAGDTTFAFADITSKPTTISGYGITDALALGTTSTTAMAGDTTFAFADITSKPTTISGYGITDAFDGAFASLSSKPTTISGYGITDALALGTTSTTALAGDTTSFGGSASSISLGTHSGTGTQTIDIGGAVISGASTNIKNIKIGNGAHNGGQTNVYIGPSSATTSAQTIIYHEVDFEYGAVNFNGTNFTVDPSGSANTITLGKTTGTGTITLGQSTQTQTIDIGSGTTASTKSKAINIGTGGASGSIRTVNIASGNISGSTTTVYIGNSSATATSTVVVQGDLSIDRPMYGNGATEYYDFYDHLGGLFSASSDGDWDISGTGLNALTEITIPARASFTGSKRGSLRMSCQSTFYNTSSSTKRNAEFYLGLQMKSKGTSAQSQNLGAGTFISSPSAYNGVWTFAGNVTDKICAGFGALANNNSAGGMTYGAAPILGVWYDDSVNKTYIRISSYYYYNNIGGSAVSAGNSTSFDVYYNPTEFKSTGTWVSSMRADNYSSRTRMTVQPQSTHQMNHSFNLSVPRDTTKTELRLIFDYSGSNTDLQGAVYAVEGTVMLEGSRV